MNIKFIWMRRNEFRGTEKKGQRDEARTIQSVKGERSKSGNRKVGVIQVSASNVDQNQD
jgi:hypothetical protein